MPHKLYYLDDEEDLLFLFQARYSDEGLSIETFSDPESLIAAVKKSTPHFVVIDYRLKGTTGDKVAAQLPADIPKAIVTGEIDHSHLTDFQHILKKPFDAEQIESLIKEIKAQTS